MFGVGAREYGGEYARYVQATAVASPTAKSTPSLSSSQRIAITPTLFPRQTSSSSSSSGDDELPAGGLTVTQPAQTADESFYKIAAHETITFGWSFTSLKTQPSRLFVVASCSQNGYTYPIAASPSGIAGDATSVTWYPYGYRMSALANGQPDLLAATYRLIIYDEQGISAAARGGQFSPSNALQFAMYFPQAYTPLARESEILLTSQNGHVDHAVVLQWCLIALQSLRRSYVHCSPGHSPHSGFFL
ncbi:hypothetical protein MPSI1_001275 [Malassezia psittaci]|uniref:DUF7137 domain-containing protein n=1 Tax=Malassezia psittaci TaxID=1821823 RepID=A0AAF0JDQ7_9BASI|nr:hypothetical protein MPSI1_001275 [Malassezia psittaci]